MKFLPVVSLFLLSWSGTTFADQDGPLVVVGEGNDVILPCSLSTKENIDLKAFTWITDGQKEVFSYNAGIHSNNGRPGQVEQFKGRVSYFPGELKNGDASIKITNTMAADSGNYSCVFAHLQSETRHIQLVVRPLVVVEGSDVILPCSLSTEKNITMETFDWKKDSLQVFFYDKGSHYNNGRRSGQSEQFKDRVSHFEDELKNGNASIIIRNTKVNDSGNYTCIFPHLQSERRLHIKLHVGAAPEPYIRTLEETKDRTLLQCEAHGVPQPEVEWRDSSGNIVPAEEAQVSKRGDRFYVTLKTTVTRTDHYSCVATQKTINHQIYAERPVYIHGPLVVKVVEGSDVILPCSLSTEEDITMETFDWKKDGLKVFFYNRGSHYNNGRSGQSEQFKGRVSHFEDELKYGNASIKITKTKVADGGYYTCIFPRPQPERGFNIQLVVGAAPKPSITILNTEDGVVLLQCVVRGASPKPKVEWKDSSGNIVPAKEPQVSERGGSYDIILEATVTKTDHYSCVVTQEEFTLQTHAEIYAIYGPVLVVGEGNDVILPCSLSTKENIELKAFTWNTDGQKQVFSYDAGIHSNNGRPGQVEQFKGRVSYFPGELKNGDASIKITNMTAADSGNYSCVFQSETRHIQLVVRSAVKVVVFEDSDAILPCSLSTGENIESKLFDWKKDGRKEVFQYDAGIHSNNGLPGQSEQFKGRVSHFEDELEYGNASIKISKTKVSDSGNYTCVFPRLQPERRFLIQLVVGDILKDRSEEISGASPKPAVTILKTEVGSLLQCEVNGASPKPEVEWKDSSGNIVAAEEPQVSERGFSYDIILQAPVTKTDIYSCVSTQEEIYHQTHAEIYAIYGGILKDRSEEIPGGTLKDRSEEIPGAAPKPCVTNLDQTKDWALLQCKVRGASPKPKVEWRNSSGNIVPAEEPQVSERGDIILQANVTKTDRYSCVSTQEDIYHQIHAEIYVLISGHSSGVHGSDLTSRKVMIAVAVGVLAELLFL